MKKKFKTHESGFKFTEKVTKYNRERYLLNGEIVGLSCKDCEQAFSLDGLNNSKTGVAGKHSICKGCNAKRRNSWDKANPEKKSAKNRRWNEENRAQKLASHHNWRAEQAGSQAKLTSDMIEELHWSRQGRCFLTGRSDVELDIDHAVPLSRGGGSHLGNLILIDRNLNRMKGTQTLIEFLGRPDVQALVSEEHVEETKRTLANYNCMKVPAYELHVQHLAEKQDKKKRSRKHLKRL